MSYFFVSYAHDDWNTYLAKFVDDLQAEIYGRAGLRDEFELTNTGAWRDGEALEAGDHWPQEIAKALATCRVFVPLYTPNYFKSRFCGMEWSLFQRRLAAERGDERVRRRLIFPVVWLPVQPLEIVHHVQYDLPLGEDNPTLGLFDLARLSFHWDDYQAFVIRAADAMRERVTALSLQPLEPAPDLELEPNAFEGVAAGPSSLDVLLSEAPQVAAPKHVVYVLVVATRTQMAARPADAPDTDLDSYQDHPAHWKPYDPSGNQTLGDWLDDVTRQEGVGWRSSLLPAVLDDPDDVLSDEGTLRNRLESALSRRFTVVIVVDIHTLALARYRNLLRAYDQSNFPNAGVVVVQAARAPDHPLLPRLVADTFERTILRGETAVQAAVGTPRELEQRLLSLFSELRTRLAVTEEPAQLVDTSEHVPFYDINPMAGR